VAPRIKLRDGINLVLSRSGWAFTDRKHAKQGHLCATRAHPFRMRILLDNRIIPNYSSLVGNIYHAPCKGTLVVARDGGMCKCD